MALCPHLHVPRFTYWTSSPSSWAKGARGVSGVQWPKRPWGPPRARVSAAMAVVPLVTKTHQPETRGSHSKKWVWSRAGASVGPL